MNWRKNKLDEQQEQKLLKIESRGLYLAYFGLMAVMIVELLISRGERLPVGEWIVFMLVSVYLIVACIRAGIWDRRLDMSRRTSVLIALAATLLTGAVTGLAAFLKYGAMPASPPVSALLWFGSSVLICFLMIYLCQRLGVFLVKRRQEKLNAEPEDSLDEEDEI